MAGVTNMVDWTAGCGESYLSGAGSAGRNSTAVRQHGRRPSTPSEYCTRETTGQCALCDALEERDRFLRLWIKGDFVREGLRAVQRGFSRAPAAQQAVVRRYIAAVWHHGQFTVLEEVLAPTFVHHTGLRLVNGPAVQGVDGVRRDVTAWRTAFPDLRFTLDDLRVAEDTVVVRWTGRGTHQGVWRGLAPTGQGITWTGISLYRLAQGKIVEQWTAEDGLGLYHQLGGVQA